MSYDTLVIAAHADDAETQMGAVDVSAVYERKRHALAAYTSVFAPLEQDH